jgi:diadenosine tetraphosphate (Ap4A) HIT family hydrolase
MPHNRDRTRTDLALTDGTSLFVVGVNGCNGERNRLSRVDYARLEIHCKGSWLWQVHENQSYLGRMILRLRRPETRSLAYCTADEWRSLQHNVQLFENIFRELFSPDRFNYSQMGNVYPQLHVQAVPRYASQRLWEGRIFYDKNWGRNWAPTPRSPLSLQEVYDFAAWLRTQIRSRVSKG